MDRIYIFIIRNDVWIYIVCGLIFLWYFADLIRARRMLRTAVHGLERERGFRLQQKAATFTISSALIIAIVIFVNFQIAPGLPEEMLRPPTPTPDIFRTPLSSPTPLDGMGSLFTDATPVIAPTVTLAAASPPTREISVPEETSQPLPTDTPSPNVRIGDCSPQVIISSPPPGVSIEGIVTFFGSASGESFGGYQLHYFGPSTGGQWIIGVDAPDSSPVFDDILGEIDFSGGSPGLYTIRLVTQSTAGSELAQCALQFSVTSEDS